LINYYKMSKGKCKHCGSKIMSSTRSGFMFTGKYECGYKIYEYRVHKTGLWEVIVMNECKITLRNGIIDKIILDQ
tara:strand:- start:3523 stop:3747 length:225 start_codon:yes stop_codon:yes gene_type:complete